MKHLSLETFHLIEQLYQIPSLFDKFLGKQEKPTLLLEKIEESADPLAIPLLLSFVFTNKKGHALAAAKTIHNLISLLSFTEFADLDERVRQMRFYYPGIWGWEKIQPGHIADLGYLKAYQASVLGVSSFLNSGYIREKAVHELGKIWTGQELPFLLIRLNDWVSNVQKAAFAAVTARLQPTYALSFVDCLPLVLLLSKRSRLVHSSTVNSIVSFLQTETSRPALYHGFHSQNHYIRRACYQIAFDAKNISPLEIIQLGMKDWDNFIRLWSVQKLKTFGENDNALPILETFRNDSYMNIRREALRIYVEKYPDLAEEELTKALLDPHRSMREEARYWMAKTSPKDFAAFYRDTLAEGIAICVAISGLGETGIASDGDLIEPFAAHPLNKIRLASIKALAKVNPEAHVDLFLRALLDKSTSISHAATKALERSSYFLDPQRLWDVLENAKHAHVKANCLFLIAHLPKWESIFYLLKATTSTDEFISKMACVKVKYWRSHFNTSFIYPTALQKKRLLNLFVENGGNLDISTRQEIESILKIKLSSPMNGETGKNIEEIE